MKTALAVFAGIIWGPTLYWLSKGKWWGAVVGILIPGLAALLAHRLGMWPKGGNA